MRRSENIVEVKIHCQIQAEKACNWFYFMYGYIDLILYTPFN